MRAVAAIGLIAGVLLAFSALLAKALPQEEITRCRSIEDVQRRSSCLTSIGQGYPSPPVTDCDRYAAHASDPQRNTAGVPYEKLDPALAIPACEYAVQQNPKADRLIFQLGRAYSKNNDAAAALAQHKRAAARGYGPAEAALGFIYEKGLGISKDDAQAVVWYRKAAKQGYTPAQFNIALMYFDGRGIAKDDSQAAYWFRTAAMTGHAEAQFNLAVMYENGVGVPKNTTMAIAWYANAAEHGSEPAKKKLAELQAGSNVDKSNTQTQPISQPTVTDQITRDIIKRETELAGEETRNCIRERIKLFARWGINEKDKIITGVMNTCGAPFLVYGNINACLRKSPLCGNFALQREMLISLIRKELGEAPSETRTISQAPIRLKEDAADAANACERKKGAVCSPGEAQELAKIEKLEPVILQARACIRSNISAAYQSGAYGHVQVIAFFKARCFSPYSTAHNQLGFSDLAEPGFNVLVMQEMSPKRP